jgi:ABC-type phosphate transport system substrate-binding protein
MQVRFSKSITAIGIALAALMNMASAEVVVVVSAKNPVASLTADQAADIFLGKSAAFPGGGNAVPMDQAEGSAVRDEFYTKAAGKNAAQLKAYWSKQIFTGQGQPPKAVGDNNGVKSAVAANPNGIGYMDKSAVDASVKPVLTVK